MKLQLIKFEEVILGLFVVLLVSCSAKHNNSADIERLELSAKVDAKLATPNEIYYEDIAELILEKNCMECHNSEITKGGVDISTYAATLGENSKKTVNPFEPLKSTLYETLTLSSGSRKMPPLSKPQLSKAQVTLIYKWIEGGAKKIGEKTPERPQSLSEELAPYFKNPEKIDYKLVNKMVFKKNCLDCHSDSGSKSDKDGAILYGQDMTNYKALFDNNGIVPDKLIDYVVSENGSLKKKKGSRIYKSMAVHQTMPPNYDGYLPVNSLYIKLVRLWILNCAIEDYVAIEGSDDLIDKEDDFTSKVRNCNTAQ